MPDEIVASIGRYTLPDNWPPTWPRPNLSGRKDLRTIYFMLPASKYSELIEYVSAPENRGKVCVGFVLRVPHDELWKSPNERGMGLLQTSTVSDQHVSLGLASVSESRSR